MIELPVCRHRRQPTAPGHHVCVSEKIRCNAAGIPDEFCLTCRYRDHQVPPPPRSRCRYFGDLLRVAPVQLKGRNDGASVVARHHHCNVHGVCIPNVEHAVLPCCLTCSDYTADWERPVAGQVRHLTYFVYPAGPLWAHNVDQLRQRMGLFNGVRLVAVATDDNSASVGEVMDMFGGCGVDVIPFGNELAKREMVAHPTLLERLQLYRSDRDVTFYGHAKGVSSHLYGAGVRRWVDELYRGNLDYWPAVQRALRTHATCGLFRRIMSPAPAAHVPWHYSGSFRWVRNKDLYARNWRAIDANWYGPETYPGHHFTLAESACLYGEFAFGGVGLYLDAEWDKWASAAADDWRKDHQADRYEPMLTTIILTAHAQPVRVHEAIASVQAQSVDRWQLVVMDSAARNPFPKYERYAGDARIVFSWTGEIGEGGIGQQSQGYAINEAWRRGLVRGELVLCLSDDDVLARTAVEQWEIHAKWRPKENAWHGIARRARLHADGRSEDLGPLEVKEPATAAMSLRGRVDGMQICVRRGAWQPWPEERELATEADAAWMERLAAVEPIWPAPVLVGAHRHTPESTFTR